MAMARSSSLVLVAFALLCCYASTVSSQGNSSDGFLSCLTASIPRQLVFTPSSPSFTPLLKSSIRNPKFFTPSTVRPLYIITPTNASHVQAAVLCGRRSGLRIRVRSGGHDYEGLSYRSVRAESFAVLDLSSLRAVRVDAQAATAWVDSGAQLGELYYAIGKASGVLGFPGGLCPTVGVGGHFSGGGFGMLLRKYGMAIDNVIDAVLVDAKGRLLNKNTMGSDVFWALRGGGGESFGVVVSWQVKLLPIPPKVTVFNVPVTASQGAADLVTRWQQVAPALPEDLIIRVVVQQKTANFQSLFLGTCDALLPVMSSRFPELRFNRSDCREMTWIQSVPYIYLGSASTVEDLLNRTTAESVFSSGYKATSDYVRQAIPRDAWASIFAKLAQPNAGLMILDPYGGQIAAVPESATPYPHRAGVLYNIQYMNFWSMASGDGAVQTRWIREFYAFMAPFVSSNPREAYFNYRDLDLGENVVVGNVSSYQAGMVWGQKYFKGNYQRLAMAKGQIDPDDYFRNEQSIPPFANSR
ncbi:berberine bridge enzyme-like Cyn d 4 [Triticum urartu]|uniref:FAD-binding PCMH-type domain-containing protein n=1 Tax=Triticum urartu TaxID=4572 RepID=A0A8R7QGV5_TRIUA|nr:berberine bridge enzyme-like Cyn d 4 [Triticum urartu]XP_048530695.1 berberine bridge enzyme-like Cyn d 4 [Triticum urartu]